jgi:hypothetical protein
MIEATIENWHRCLRGDFAGGLEELLHDDVVFYSPIVFTPQRGKVVTMMYLKAAYSVFGGNPSGADDAGADDDGPPGSFRYVNQTLSGNSAALEFETRLDGKYVNGVDLISCDDDGLIVEFKVMIRPLQAINVMHDKMMAMLAAGEA